MLDSLLKQNIAVLDAAILGWLLVSLVLIGALVLRPRSNGRLRTRRR